jgi:hypothetical protein
VEEKSRSCNVAKWTYHLEELTGVRETGKEEEGNEDRREERERDTEREISDIRLL